MERSLLQRIEVFLKESSMPPSVFGRAAVHDPRLVSDLRGGREPGLDVICRTEHFMNKWRADRHAGRVVPQGDRRSRAFRRTGKEARV
ncbi:hypothetical protein [Sphingopyxis sp. JAI128]|uniref:hypothetical protein n=1 Tax=Sphingopyxis sp. JAI128 TaxID=2723066 RepID=UPI001609D8B9|nr:hypothetical protein [Sphingopyxis sp. JAI128]MBB6427558.1 hypothetical protein [Sphingopyxis sp. JAI128]